MTEKKTTVAIGDMGLASVLDMRGFLPVSRRTDDKGLTLFIYESTPELHAVQNAYRANQIVVPAQGFMLTYRSLMLRARAALRGDGVVDATTEGRRP